MQKHIAKPLQAAKSPRRTKTSTAKPNAFTYALASYTIERRVTGWYVARTVASFAGEKPKWAGPFQDLENACLSAARHMATEIADRHTRSIEQYKIKRDDPLYGLKPTTRLAKAK